MSVCFDDYDDPYDNIISYEVLMEMQHMAEEWAAMAAMFMDSEYDAQDPENYPELDDDIEYPTEEEWYDELELQRDNQGS